MARTKLPQRQQTVARSESHSDDSGSDSDSVSTSSIAVLDGPPNSGTLPLAQEPQEDDVEEDEDETYQLELTQKPAKRTNNNPPASDLDDEQEDDRSMQSPSRSRSQSYASLPRLPTPQKTPSDVSSHQTRPSAEAGQEQEEVEGVPGTEEEGDDERGSSSEEDDEDEEEEEEEGSHRSRSRSVSSRASTVPPSPQKDAMQVDERSPVKLESPSRIKPTAPAYLRDLSPLSPTSSPEKAASVRISALMNPAIEPVIPPPSGPGEDASSVPHEAEASSSTKPVSKQKRKRRSPSPVMPTPAPRPPLQTIRLTISIKQELGGEKYEVDVAERARAAGMLPPLPGVMINDGHISESEKDEEKDKEKNEGTGGQGPDGTKKRKRRKRNAAAEYYDVNDPFIDDTELARDERTHTAQTKQQGFYVSSGEVALLKDKSPKKTRTVKPKSTAPSAEAEVAPVKAPKPKPIQLPLTANGLLAMPIPGSTPGPSTNGISLPALPPSLVPRNGSRHSPELDTFPPVNVKVQSPTSSSNLPFASSSSLGESSSAVGAGIPLSNQTQDTDPQTGQKRKRYVTVGGAGTPEGGKKRKVVDIKSFHPLLQEAMDGMKAEVNKVGWQKGKFPQELKPKLADLAVLAIKLGEYDEHFFNLMPLVFPYNRFTMTKLIKRTIFTQHTTLLAERQDLLLTALKRQAEGGFDTAKAEWERAVMNWSTRQERARIASEQGGVGSGMEDGVGDGGGPGAGDGDVDMDADGQPPPSTQGPGASAQAKRDANPPQKKFRLTDAMKAIIWELVLLSNECVRLENEKNTLENSVIQVSEQARRKDLYQKIVASFPEGWMNSGQISREVSAIKKKLEKETGTEE